MADKNRGSGFSCTADDLDLGEDALLDRSEEAVEADLDRLEEEMEEMSDPDYEKFLHDLQRRADELEAVPKPEGLRIDIRRGSEGPRHDPYSFIGYRVETPDGRRIEYKSGLTTTLRVDGAEIARSLDELDPSTDAIRLRFEALAGYDLDQLEHWHEFASEVPCMGCGTCGCDGSCVI